MIDYPLDDRFAATSCRMLDFARTARRGLRCPPVLVVLCCGFFVTPLPTHAQVVRFRLETTDAFGSPIDSVVVGEEFFLQTYTQHVGGFESAENAGVFAAYLDITFDHALATVAGEVQHGSLYANGTSGDLATPGRFDNIGGFSSSEGIVSGLTPIGLGEEHVFRVPMRATAAGQLSFLGVESQSYPQFDVLVYSKDEPVPARDIDFGAVETRIEFGDVMLRVQSVPEPASQLLALLAAVLVARCGRFDW